MDTNNINIKEYLQDIIKYTVCMYSEYNTGRITLAHDDYRISIIVPLRCAVVITKISLLFLRRFYSNASDGLESASQSFLLRDIAPCGTIGE
jgi:hypothetical protein